MFLKSALILIYFFLVKASNCDYSKEEDLLEIESNITASFKYTTRPSSRVACSMKLSLIKLAAVDDKSQIITTFSYLTLSWLDPRLAWRANVSRVFIPSI
jgi:hypothetical protein